MPETANNSPELTDTEPLEVDFMGYVISKMKWLVLWAAVAFAAGCASSNSPDATTDTGGHAPGDTSDDAAPDVPTDAPPDSAGDGVSDTTSDTSVTDTHTHTPNPLKAEMYGENAIQDFYLTFTAEDWQTLLNDHTNKIEKNEVRCGFAWKDQTFADAACRPKGNIAAWPDEKKPQLIVKFNHWNKDGRFNGLRKLNLEANAYCAAPVRDRLGMWLMRQAGIDAPRANHVRVFVNGELLGVYQNLEPLDHEFLEDHFPNAYQGNLYENGYILQTNKDVNNQEDIWALDDLVDDEPLEGDHAAFFAALPKHIDVSQVLLEMAAETVLPTADNFINGSWNYYWYHHPERGFMLLPWDLDTIMDEYSIPTADLYDYQGEPDIGNPPNKLRQLMNQNPEWLTEFENNLVAVRDGPYSSLADRVDYVCTQIREAVAADPNAQASIEDFDADCADIKSRIQQRIQYITTTLNR